MVFERKDIGFRGLWEVEVELEGIEGMYVEVRAIGEQPSGTPHFLEVRFCYHHSSGRL